MAAGHVSENALLGTYFQHSIENRFNCNVRHENVRLVAVREIGIGQLSSR